MNRPPLRPAADGGARSDPTGRSRPLLRACQRVLGTGRETWRSVTDEHLLATGGLVDVFISRFGEPGGKTAGLPALPIEFGIDRRRPGVHRQPPRMGEHNAELLSEARFAAGEIERLAKAGVIASRGGEA